jgi:hypothetical protein
VGDPRQTYTKDDLDAAVAVERARIFQLECAIAVLTADNAGAPVSWRDDANAIAREGHLPFDREQKIRQQAATNARCEVAEAAEALIAEHDCSANATGVVVLREFARWLRDGGPAWWMPKLEPEVPHG